MRLALLWQTGIVTGSNTLYVTFSTTWSSAAASTSISMSSDSAVATMHHLWLLVLSPIREDVQVQPYGSQ
jgi:hypothetical protein